MENPVEKPNNNKVGNKPPVSAYLWLAGIMAIVFAVIYISLILRVHFLSVRGGIIDMRKSEELLLFAFIILVLLGTLYMYVVFSRRELLFNIKEPAAILTVFTLVVTANIFLAYVSPYLMFVSLTSLLAFPFSKKRDAFVLNIFACLISSNVLLNTLSVENYDSIVLTIAVGVMTGAVASYTLQNSMTRFSSIVRAFLTGAVMILGYFVLLSVFTLGFTMFNENIMYIGIAAAGQLLLTGVIVPLIENIFNITTDFKLVELTNHRAPLIKRLSTEAPGTFNHCQNVANLAEICATAIGEDPYFARACAYYHDVGKLNNVTYFTENQGGGSNPHDELLPEVSAEIIRRHTTDGYDICRKYHIPEEVARITVQHHGTLPITYFYNRAKSLTDSAVDVEEYRYHGETPTGKMGAIIMICDSAEAAIRAMDNPDGEKVDKLLKAMIDERLKYGQFDNCDITMCDLNTLRLAIVGAYGGLFHKRIKYDNAARGERSNAHV